MMRKLQSVAAEPEIVVDGDVPETELSSLRAQVRVLGERLAEEIRKNERGYSDRQADRAAQAIAHDRLHGANQQLLRDRAALEERVLQAEIAARMSPNQAAHEAREYKRIAEAAAAERDALRTYAIALRQAARDTLPFVDSRAPGVAATLERVIAGAPPSVRV